MPSYHTNWELLQDQRPDQRARLFMAGCKELGITGDPLLKDLCDVLDCLPDAYPNGETEPSLDAVIKILDKYSDSISKPDEDNLRGQIDELRKASVSEHHKLSVSTNTYLFAFTALIEVMAASSKLGLGGEDYTCFVEGSRLFASQLFQDEKMLEKIILVRRHAAITYKTDPTMMKKLLIPFEFAFSCLLPLAERKKLSEKLGPIFARATGTFPKDMSSFAEIQTRFFEGCLTKCSQGARSAYKELLAPGSAEDDLFGMNDSLPAELRSISISVCNASHTAIRSRVEDAEKGTHGKDNIKEAISWLRNAPVLLDLGAEETPAEGDPVLKFS